MKHRLLLVAHGTGPSSTGLDSVCGRESERNDLGEVVSQNALSAMVSRETVC